MIFVIAINVEFRAEEMHLIRCNVIALSCFIITKCITLSFRHGPVVRILAFHVGGRGSIPRGGVFVEQILSLLISKVSLFEDKSIWRHSNPSAMFWIISGIQIKVKIDWDQYRSCNCSRSQNH
eukprot:NODE_184_length_15718_cov_0.161342.p12 type:complete len:123 gc:universal NODE_184_length_15718_cov_0.161342:8335-7967(-)